MAHPKHRFSKSRTLKRRAQYKAEAPTIMVCSNCGAPVKLHRVCGECGYYKGKLAIENEKVA